MECVVIMGAHPDDELSAAGLALRMRGIYDVHILNATMGERGIAGLGFDEAAAIRRLEAENAARLLGATPHFLGEIDGELCAGQVRCRETAALLRRLKPKALFTHWPVDIHTDHVVCTALAFRAILMAGIQPEILFGEETYQSRSFVPEHFVDVTGVFDRKIAAIRCHVSQNADDVLVADKTLNARFRGAKCRVEYAEAFARFHPGGAPGSSILDAFRCR